MTNTHALPAEYKRLQEYIRTQCLYECLLGFYFTHHFLRLHKFWLCRQGGALFCRVNPDYNISLVMVSFGDIAAGLLRAVKVCVEIRTSHYKYQDLAIAFAGSIFFMVLLQKLFAVPTESWL
ncbi:hypothetical protein ACSAYR_28235 (plasmid) [Escherichia coli]